MITLSDSHQSRLIQDVRYIGCIPSLIYACNRMCFASSVLSASRSQRFEGCSIRSQPQVCKNRAKGSCFAGLQAQLLDEGLLAGHLLRTPQLFFTWFSVSFSKARWLGLRTIHICPEKLLVLQQLRSGSATGQVVLHSHFQQRYRCWLCMAELWQELLSSSEKEVIMPAHMYCNNL